jgi:hypothetical protein
MMSQAERLRPNDAPKIWEMVNWLDTHVKPPEKSTSQ